ncbi:MAG: hypothetical protein ABI693_21660 [Bryobacteraceae bacterium]
MTVRNVRATDLAECLSLNPSAVGDQIVGRNRAIAVWEKLLASPAFVGCVVETAQPVRGSRIAAFGASVLVSSNFSDAEKANPRPGLNARIIASVESESVVLTFGEIAIGNSRHGLDVAVLYGRIRQSVLSSEEIAEADLRMAERFFHGHGGYRLRRFLLELADQEDIDHAQALASWRVWDRYENFHATNPGNGWNQDRALALIEVAEAHSVAASIASKLFVYHEPLLSLARAEQELLLLTLEGHSDNDIALRLRISLPAVKNRWMLVFHAFETTGIMPELWQQDKNVGERRQRGPQKRHRVLEYLRLHPEELRPRVIRQKTRLQEREG